MKRWMILSIITCLALFSCKKDDDGNLNCSPTPVPNDSTAQGISYTPTDDKGVIFGPPDTTDWRFESNWGQSERDLFPLFDTYNHSCVKNDTLRVNPAFPNPNNGQFKILFEKTDDTRIWVAIVNQEQEKISSLDSINTTLVAFDLTSQLSPSDSIVRVYYLFVENDTCAFGGHGDIKIN